MEKIYSSKYSDLIIRDRVILIIDNKGNRRLCNVNSGKLKIAKREINTNYFENKKINTFWQVDSFPYEQIYHRDFFENESTNPEDEENNDTEKEMKNNKEIYSLGSQKLTGEDIKKMKESGLKGDELIKVIMDNNSSMDKRTTFSQEKMLRKKKAKHTHQIWIVSTNIFNIIETFFIEDEKRINYMRMDTFSTMLVYSHFGKNAKTLIYEEIDNILTSVYASRSSVKSNVVSLFNTKLNNKNLAIFNLRRKNKYIITHLDIETLTDKENFNYNLLSKRYRLNFENLVICIKSMSDVILVTMKLFDYLKYSGGLIVYSREIEYLVSLEKLLFENKFAMDVRIHETYLREYQVLSMRTHPMMNNKGFSGYVLTAIKTKTII